MIKELIKDIVGEDNIYFNEVMSKHTTFKIGGPADVFVIPRSTDELCNIIKVLKDNNEPYYIIGKGSNLLVSDKGYRGVIICLYNTLDKVEVLEDNESVCRVVAGSGIMLSKLANIIADNSLEGFEFASGIPGTLGGAVAMNAGAYGGEIKDCILSAKVLTDKCEILTLTKEELQLSYRNSIILQREYIVLEAEFQFHKGNKDDIKAKMVELNMRRKEKQPLEYPSAGSTFKRPEGYFAGKLIMDSDLAGYSVGDACVSTKHCGFVINKGHATAEDTVKLIKDIDRIVYNKFGVHLEPEVRMIGEW